MKIELLSPTMIKKTEFKTNSVFIVVDTFRASTSMVTLIDSGAEKIYVVSDGKKAKKLQKNISPFPILIGEKKGYRIKGFEYGNRPSLFYDLDFRGLEVIFTSTSGAMRILMLEGYDHILVGSLVNLNSVSKKALELAKKEKSDIYIIPAGNTAEEQEYVAEDWVTSLLIAQDIQKIDKQISLVNGELLTKTEKLLTNNADIDNILKESKNGIHLKKIGFRHDVNFALQMNKISCVPKLSSFENCDGFSYAVMNPFVSEKKEK